MRILSPRQQAVMDLIAAGRSNGFIARTLGIGLGTVRRRAEGAYGRLGVPMGDPDINPRVAAANTWWRERIGSTDRLVD